MAIEFKKKKAEEKKKPETPVEIVVSWLKTIVGAVLIVMVLSGAVVQSFVVPTPSMERTVWVGDFLFVNKFIYGPSSPQIIPFLNIPLPFFRLPGFRAPEKGDVIVFIYPGDRDEVEPREFMYYLKRCVATAGDTVEVRNNVVFVNGAEQPLPENGLVQSYDNPRLDDAHYSFPRGRGFTRTNYGPLRVPKAGDKIALTPSALIEWETFIRREGHEVSVSGGSVLIDGKAAAEYTVERDYVFGMGDNRDESSDSRFWGYIPVENVVGTPMVVYWSWETNNPSFFDKLASIRFGRVGTIIH